MFNGRKGIFLIKKSNKAIVVPVMKPFRIGLKVIKRLKILPSVPEMNGNFLDGSKDLKSLA